MTAKFGVRGDFIAIGRLSPRRGWVALACGTEGHCWAEIVGEQLTALWRDIKVVEASVAIEMVDDKHKPHVTGKPVKQGMAGYQRKVIRCTR